jgi:hypothetical protein
MQRTRPRNATRRQRAQEEWEATNRRLAAPVPDELGWHNAYGLIARHDPDGVWRFLDARPGDEILTAAEIAQLVPYRLAG